MGAPRRNRSVLLVFALIALCAGAGFTVVGVASHAAGRGRLEAVLAEQAAAGHGVSYRDLVLSAPPVDRARQDAARAWMKRQDDAVDAALRVPADVRWAFRDPTAPPPALVAAHEALREDVADLRVLLGPGDLCLTSLGWLDLTPEQADHAPLSKRAGMHLPNLLRVRAAARWLSEEALLADDPESALADLDRLHAALSRPGCLLDAMIAVAIDALRDETYLVLVLLGRLDEARRDAWLDEAPREAALAAEGWRGERLVFAAPLAQDLARGVTLAKHMGAEVEIRDPGDFWRWHVRPFFTAAADAATFLEGMLALERHLRGTLDAGETRAALERLEGLGAPFDLMVPNAQAVVTSVAVGTTQARSTRAAAALALASRARGRPARDGDEARAWLGPRAGLLEEGAFARALRYEPRGADGFRVAPDLDAPLPSLLSDYRFPWREGTDAPWFDGEVFRRRGASVEIRLP